VPDDLRLPVEAAAGVVEVDLSPEIEPGVLRVPQLVDATRRLELGITTQKGSERLGLFVVDRRLADQRETAERSRIGCRPCRRCL
jgi:hypothetical protein